MPKHADVPPQQGLIIQQSMGEVLVASMMPYAEYVILERALPRVEDGLKPVQRRILYTMSELSLEPDKPHRKCARIVGDCLGKYHPHGDTSVYDALVRMAQLFSLRAPLVDGHGNFGSVDGDSAAAMRYTEARMTPLATLMLCDIEKDTTPFRNNFDDTLKEPDMLPARFPALLVNGASGIAVGIATNIPPHNLGETVDAVVAMLDKPDIDTRGLMKHIKGPDFPTGGILFDTAELLAAYETGRGKLTVRAKVDIEHEKSGKKLLVISELPYQVGKASLLEKILKLSEEKKGPLAFISDIRDESDRTGMRAVIELKRDADEQKVLAWLYKYSDLQTTFGVNMVAIADGKPAQLGLLSMIAHYIRHQKNVVSRRTAFDLEAAKKRAHILEGLIIAVDHIDAIIRLIRSSKTPKEAREKLMATYALSEIQAQAILDMRLQRLTGLEILELKREYEEMRKLIESLEAILADDKKLVAVVRRELLEVKKLHADARRTLIVGEAPALEVSVEDALPPPEEAVLILTRGGFLRRFSVKAYAKAESEAGSVEELPRFAHRTDTAQKFLLITDAGIAYTFCAGDVPETKPKARGLALGGLLAGFENTEKTVALIPMPERESDTTSLVFFTTLGQAKRTALSEYRIRTKRFPALGLKNGDTLLTAVLLDTAACAGENRVLIATRAGMSIAFDALSLPHQGRAATGVRAVMLDMRDRVISASIAGEEGEWVVATDRGYLKRVLLCDIDVQDRGGKGRKLWTFGRNHADGEALVAAFPVKLPVKVDVTLKDGAVQSIGSEEIALAGRADRGLPYVMALMGNIVVSVDPAREA